jgi:hypothetical protein
MYTRKNPTPSAKAVAAAVPESVFRPLHSGSKWSEDHLKFLGVKYDIDDQYDLACGPLRITKREWDTIYAQSTSITLWWTCN